MISKKVVQQIRELEIHTKRILQGMQVGGSRARQKGFGLEFDQLRQYQYGDDIRLIDWKSSARMGDKLLVRQYFEERNRIFMICLDISASTFFGSAEIKKQAIMQQISGALAFAAEYGKDRVGLILFSDHVEKVIPPGKGKQHIHRIIEMIFTHIPQSKKTDLSMIFHYIAYTIPKHSVVFIISDFISDDSYEFSLKQAGASKEIIAISCFDQLEQHIPPVGLLRVKDLEASNSYTLLDTRNMHRSSVAKLLQDRLSQQKKLFFSQRIDFLELSTHNDFLRTLILFFSKAFNVLKSKIMKNDQSLNQLIDVYDVWYQPWWSTWHFYTALFCIIGLLTFTSIFYIIRRYFRKRQFSFEQIALLDLQQLHHKLYHSEKDMREAYFEMTMIMKRYLSKRYHVSVVEKTDNQFLESMRSLLVPELFVPMQELFERIHHIKFAHAAISENMLYNDIDFMQQIIYKTVKSTSEGTS